MCGIVGYVGKKVPVQKILSKLQGLEYRGYDSSGVAYFDGEIKLKKDVGTIGSISKEMLGINSELVISHTRWATHGEVNKTNAHPHLSYGNNYVVVHNGIIENYKELKAQIGEDKFASTTDTEVICNLMETQSGRTFERFDQTVSKLVGSYAILLFDKMGGTLYAAKNKSPLYAAKSPNGYLLASDVSCFEDWDYYVLEDGMVATITQNLIKFYIGKEQVFPQLQQGNNLCEQTAKGEYKFFMQKEIAETPQVLKNICKTYQKLAKNKQFLHIFGKNSKVLLCGCGSAYHACALGARWIGTGRKLDARAAIASEIKYFGKITKKHVVILLSQSGETADTLAVLEKAKKAHAKTIVITNTMHSTMARKADYVLPLCAGPEVAVASTKAYSAMLAVLYIISCKNAGFAIKNLSKYIKNANNVSTNSQIIEQIANAKRIFFIGRGDDAITASEGALKLKETCYLDSYGYYAGELKHGTIALVEPGTIIIAVITNNRIKDKTINAVEECLSRGAEAMVVSNQIIQNKKIKQIQLLPNLPSQIYAIDAVIELQKLSCAVADKRNCNPDRPRNLAKSVTVE